MLSNVILPIKDGGILFLSSLFLPCLKLKKYGFEANQIAIINFIESPTFLTVLDNSLIQYCFITISLELFCVPEKRLFLSWIQELDTSFAVPHKINFLQDDQNLITMLPPSALAVSTSTPRCYCGPEIRFSASIIICKNILEKNWNSFF